MHKDYSELGLGLGLRLHDLSPRRVSSSMYDEAFGGSASLRVKQTLLSRPRDVSINSGTRSLSAGRTSFHGTSASLVQNRYSSPPPRIKDHGSNNPHRYGGPMFSRPKDGADNMDMMEYANVNAVLSRLSILPMEMKGFLHGTSLKEKLETIRKTLDDDKVSSTSELDAWREKWKRESIHRRLHPDRREVRFYNSSDPKVCSLRQGQVNTKNLPSSMRWRNHQERTPDRCRDQIRFHPREHIQLQSRDRIQLQSQDQTRLEIRDQNRDQTRLHTRDQTRLQNRDQPQLYTQDQSRDNIQLQSRDQIRLQNHDQIRLQSRDEAQDQSGKQFRESIREQFQDQTPDQTRLQNRDQPQLYTEDQGRDNIQLQSRDQIRLQSQDQIRLQSRDEAQDQSGKQFRESNREQFQDQTREQTANEQKIDCLPYSDHSREQTREKFRRQIGDLGEKTESLPYSDSGRNKDQPRDQTGEQIDYGQKIECLPYSDQTQEQVREKTGYGQQIECLLYSDSDEHENQIQDQTIEQIQEQTRDQTQDGSRDQSSFGQKMECLHYSASDQSRHQIRMQTHSGQKIECLHYSDSGQNRNQIRNPFQEKIQDQFQEEIREKFREQAQDQTQRQTGIGQKIECLSYSDQSRRQSAEKFQRQAQDQIRLQTGSGQRIECLPYSDQRRRQSEEQFQEHIRGLNREQFREQTGFSQKFESFHDSDSDQSNAKNHLYLRRIIDGSRKEFALRTFEKFVHSRLTHYMLMYITACAKGLMGDDKTKFLSLFKAEGAFKHKPLNEGTYCELLRFVDNDSNPSKDVVKALDVAETSLQEEGIRGGYDLIAIGDIRTQMRAFISLGRSMSSFITCPPISEGYHDECLFTVELLQDLIRSADQAKLGALQGLHKLIKLGCFLALKGMDCSSSSD